MDDVIRPGQAIPLTGWETEGDWTRRHFLLWPRGAYPKVMSLAIQEVGGMFEIRVRTPGSIIMPNGLTLDSLDHAKRAGNAYARNNWGMTCA